MERRYSFEKFPLLLSSSSSATSVFFFFLSLSLSILPTTKAFAVQSATIPINVGVILDMDQWIGQIGMSCISMALSDFYSSHGDYRTRLVLNRQDSKGDVIGAAAAALDLLKNVEAQAIIGPASSMQADFVIDLGEQAHVPIISFSATSPSLASIPSQYFIRVSQNDSSQVRAITSIIQAFGWRQAVPIYVGNQFGEGIIPFLTDALNVINTRVPYRSVIPPLATDDQIAEELYKLMTMQTRVFIVHMLTDLGSRLFTKAKELGMMSEGYAWIITDAMTNELNSIQPSHFESMEGVIGVKPYVPKSKELDSFTKRWKLTINENNPRILHPQLNVFGLWAYDSATALAMAVEKAGDVNNSFQKPNISINSTDLETFGVSKNGAKLLQAILSTTFRGLSGDFNIIDGTLQSPVYQLVNVVGNGVKGIGFWTIQNGITRYPNLTNSNIYSTKKSNFGAIIWPGDTTTPPKGWVIPISGKTLRIGVPVKDGFSEFVRVMRDLNTNTTTVTGYCIDVFDEVVASLPYAVPYEYIPFAASDGESAGTYNDLVYEVNLRNYDAAVGDITITANRSTYVDFSLPFTESGVSMIVPIKDNQSRNAWVFLKPLTWKLWLASFFCFVLIGVLIWILEHRINEEFRGPPWHQIGIIFWFSFSTMVFAQKERIVSNLARFVLIIWFLVVLILTSSYTASLTSMLTVQQLQPTVTDIHELVKTKAYVGYQKGSFVLGFLLQLGFDESRLLVYNSPEECDQLFTNGNGADRIAAAVDEIPFINLVLARYCSKYTTVQPTSKTAGFGFVFPIGSPLVTDVSRAVLNVTEGDTMVEIEDKWFAKTSDCQSNPSLSSNSLDVTSFGGLFLMVGIAGVLAFFIYLATFLREHWNVVTNPNYSVKETLAELARTFYSEDLRSPTIGNIGQRVGTSVHDADRDKMGANDGSSDQNRPQSPVTFSLPTSTGTNAPPSPSLSNTTEQNLSLAGGQGSSSDANSGLNQSDTSHDVTPEIEVTSPDNDVQTTN